MTTTTTSNWRKLSPAFYAFLIAIAALWAIPRNACAQLYVSQLDKTIGIVSKYDTTGKLIKANFITGLNFPGGLALSGDTLFVVDHGNNLVGKYAAATGGAINPGFITGLNFPTGLAVTGDTLFVANELPGTVGAYNVTTGAPINASFISGLTEPFGLAVKDNTLFVANYGNGTVGAYNATTGAPINASFISGLTEPFGLAIKGNALFVADYGNGTVGKYDATTGAAISTSFIRGLTGTIALVLFRGETSSRDTLFVASESNIAQEYKVGKYAPTTGNVIKANFITGLTIVGGIAVKSAK
jgi:hypothetical protein